MKTNKNLSLCEFIKEIDSDLKDYEIISAIERGNIASAILNKRAAMKLKQKEFSAFMGVSQGLVSRWENGTYNFTIEKLIEVFDKLNMEVKIIFSERKNKMCPNYSWEQNLVVNETTIKPITSSESTILPMAS